MKYRKFRRNRLRGCDSLLLTDKYKATDKYKDRKTRKSKISLPVRQKIMTTIMTMFATFVAFVGGIVLLTEAVNKIFKIENSKAKLLVSWFLSIGLACLGFWFQLGFFADCGTPDQWQGWVKVALIGLGCGLCANKMYDREEIWRLLEWIFSIFTPAGKRENALIKK